MEGKINHKDFPSALLGGGEEVAPRGLWRHRKGTENWVEKYSLTQKKASQVEGQKHFRCCFLERLIILSPSTLAPFDLG